MKNHASGNQRQGDGDNANQCGSPITEVEADHQRDDQTPHQYGASEILPCHFNESRRAKDSRVDLHSAEAGLHRRKGRFDALRHFHCVSAGKFFDNQQQAVAIVRKRVSDQRLVVFHNISHITNAHGAAPRWFRGFIFLSLADQQCKRGLHGNLGQAFRRHDRRDVLDAHPLLRCVNETGVSGRRRLDKAQRRHPQCVPDRFENLEQRDLVGAQTIRIYLHLQLPVPHSPDCHVGHPGHAHQAGCDCPTRQHRHLDGGKFFRR